MIRQIAVGGMAELYLTRTVGIEGFEKLACVKRILPQYTDDPGFVNMFLGEARLAATLHHPNIAQVYDIGHESGEFFFSMEYVHGEDLGRLVTASHEYGVPISLDCALTIAAGLCAGLHHAHDKTSADGKPLGVVHRDVSPTNVLVSYDGAVKLVDFGIARAGGDPSSMPGLKGKIAYMSPEQARGRALDRRSDVFSVGTILYELTTGQRPFVDRTEFGVLQRIIQGDLAPPGAIVPGYPPALEAIVMQALACEPDRRFSTALALQNQIEDFAHENRLRVSPLVLARVMSALFPARLEEWDHARAQGAFFVEQHVVRTLIESGKTAEGASHLEPEPAESGGPALAEGTADLVADRTSADLVAPADQTCADLDAPAELAVPQERAEELTQRDSAPEDYTLVSNPESNPGWQGTQSATPLDEAVTTPAPRRPPPPSLSGTMPSLSQASSVRMRPSPSQVTLPPSPSSPPRPHSSTIPSLSQASSVRMRPSPSQVLPAAGSSQALPVPAPASSSTALSSMQLAAPASQTLLPQAPQAQRAGRGSRWKQPAASGSSPGPLLADPSLVGSLLADPSLADPSLAGPSLPPSTIPGADPDASGRHALAGASGGAAYAARPVPRGGTLVSSAMPAGKPPAGRVVPGPSGHERNGPPGPPGRAAARGPQSRPRAAVAPAGPAVVEARRARPRRAGAEGDARSGLDDVTDRVRAAAQPTLMIRHRRWRPPLIAVAFVGVVGVAVGVWLGLRNPQASAVDPSRSPGIGASQEAVIAPAADVQGNAAQAQDRAAQDPEAAARAQTAETGTANTAAAPATAAAPTTAKTTKAAETATTAEATPAAPRADSHSDSGARRTDSADSTAATDSPAPRGAARTSESRGDGLATRKTRNAQVDPQSKPAAKLVKKRAESKRPKRQPKEQAWNDDSPFMPVTTPPR